MKAAQKKKLKAQLLERQAGLAQAYRRTQEANRRSGAEDGPLDLADTATELYTQEFNYSLSEGERDQLLQVTQALQRLEDGDYGECQECGEEISEQRLNALPWAAYCISCQEKRERLAARR